ncbi:alpha/beta hydrolase [[Pseudopropionibacterium] massiliense]|uniref:alpha/beta hydrolase n=1 Tax=[Pseudopropionibacterium] massiliense TaxID=2220000 RepID=UPI001031FC56|nr:alpha/beta hydrolase-fold protein [[Pseudopropionibacterium] massiliense]
MSLNHSITRRSIFKGAGGIAAASFLGAGAVLGGSASPAHAASDLKVVAHQTIDRMEYYRFSTSCISWTPRVNILLPKNYGNGCRFPVLYLLHGSSENFTKFDKEVDIRNLAASHDLIIVMPDGGSAGWYCNPVTSNAGPQKWETFHIEQLIPWVDANFRTIAQCEGRAISGFSMGGFGALKYTAKYSNYFASVSCHSGPANLRGYYGRTVVQWVNSSSSVDLAGGYVYGSDENRIKADNPVDCVEKYKGKRIFLVSGTDSKNSRERCVVHTHREFRETLHKHGIKHEHCEDSGGQYIRKDRLKQDLDGIVGHLWRPC